MEDTGKEVYDVVIIGSGPAGLTAALYTARARLKTLVIDSMSILGQVAMTDHIENYPGFPDGIAGPDMLDRFKKQAENFEAAFAYGDVRALDEVQYEGKPAWKVSTDDNSYRGLSVIVATGAAPRMLNIPGEKEFRGKGVSYCATCDGPFFKNKHIVVTGGGDTAVQEACFLTSFAQKVTLVHRRDRLRATKILQERAFANKKLTMVWDSVITEIKGTKKVEGVLLTNKKTGEEHILPCDGVFIFIGLIPNTGFLPERVQRDEGGYIKTDMQMKTGVPGIFAAGDCRAQSFWQIVIACGDGACAALSAQHYVEELKGIAYK